MNRYDQLLNIFGKCLSESSKCIDTKLAVEECYGDDLSMFATSSSSSSKPNDDGVDMLENLVRDILDKINESFLQNELPKILSKEKVELKLNILDQVIQEYLREQREKEELENNDIESARDAVANTKFIPQGMNLGHMLTYQSYQMKLKMKDELNRKVEHLEAERGDLLKQIEVAQNDVKSVVSGIDKSIVEPLNKNADICTFNGIS